MQWLTNFQGHPTSTVKGFAFGSGVVAIIQYLGSQMHCDATVIDWMSVVAFASHVFHGGTSEDAKGAPPSAAAKVVLALFIALWLVSGPTPVEAQSTTLTSVLTWSDADTIDQVQIDKGPANTGPFTKLSTVAPGTLTYTDATNAPGTTACYRVENVNSSGSGPSSNVACKTFPPLPTVAPVLNPIQ